MVLERSSPIRETMALELPSDDAWAGDPALDAISGIGISLLLTGAAVGTGAEVGKPDDDDAEADVVVVVVVVVEVADEELLFNISLRFNAS